jgi:hypothetical protein
MKLIKSLFISALSLLASVTALADIERIEITSRNILSDSNVEFSYESIFGVAYFTLDPREDLNEAVTDIAYAPVNGDGLIEYAVDFRLLVPSVSVANGGFHPSDRYYTP